MDESKEERRERILKELASSKERFDGVMAAYTQGGNFEKLIHEDRIAMIKAIQHLDEER